MSVRYDSQLAAQTYDAVLIGSGIGSLTTAVFLAEAGMKVLVLERHYEPGGFMHTFRRKNFEWDVGIHYVGMVHRENSLERRLSDYLTGGRLKWADMGSPYDRAIIDGDPYDFVPDPRRQLEEWIRAFPAEERAIERYWELVREVQPASRSFFMTGALPPLIGTPLAPLLRRKFLRHADRSTYDVLSELTDNERLIDVLCAQCGDYGLPPRESSFAIHAMVVYHYRWGGAYPHGGGRSIHGETAKTIEQQGGLIARRAGVAEILVQNGKACGVVLENGDEIRAERVISGAGVHNTYTRLLPEAHRHTGTIDALLGKAKRSASHVCLYVGLDADDKTLGLPKTNHWIYDTLPEAPGMRITDAYLSFPSAKDPEWARKHPGTAALQVIAPADYAEFAPWADEKWRRRGEDYEQLKAKHTQRLLNYLHTYFPQTKGHEAWVELSTPLSTAHFAGYGQGEIYGLAHDPARFRLKGLGPRTHVPNLFLTGQDVATAGMMGAIIGGALTASAILKKNTLKAIRQTA